MLKPNQTMEEYFAEKEKAKQPISQEKQDQIKSDFSLDLEPVDDVYDVMPEAFHPPQPKPQAIPSPVSQLDTEAIKSKAEELSPKRSIGDYAAFLAPLAVEALFGGGESSGVSMDIAGKLLMEDADKGMKRQQSLEDKLLDMEKSYALSKAKSKGEAKLPTASNMVQVEGPDGKPVWKWVSDAAGETAFSKPRGGLSYEERLQLMREAAALRAKAAKTKLSTREKERVQDLEVQLSSEWSKDKFTQGTRAVADSYNRLISLDPDSKEPVKDIGIIFDFMKSLDPNSVVRESEQNMLMGAKSVGDFVDNLSDMMARNRKLTPDQVRGIQKFASLSYKRRLEAQNSQVNKKFYAQAEKYGLDPNVIMSDLSMGVPMMITSTKTGKTKIISVPEKEVTMYENAGAVRVK